jgi:hypothetical protein
VAVRLGFGHQSLAHRTTVCGPTPVVAGVQDTRGVWYSFVLDRGMRSRAGLLFSFFTRFLFRWRVLVVSVQLTYRGPAASFERIAARPLPSSGSRSTRPPALRRGPTGRPRAQFLSFACRAGAGARGVRAMAAGVRFWFLHTSCHRLQHNPDYRVRRVYRRTDRMVLVSGEFRFCF